MGNSHKSAQIKKYLFGKKPLTEQPHSQFRRFEAENLRDALEQVLQSEEYPPPSMREVAQRLNYDQSHLRRHLPDLCRAISARYLAYQREQRQRRLEEMSAKV
jgi:AraC-like DNA-binding protein